MLDVSNMQLSQGQDRLRKKVCLFILFFYFILFQVFSAGWQFSNLNTEAAWQTADKNPREGTERKFEYLYALSRKDT